MNDHLESERIKSSDEAWLVVDRDQWTDAQLTQLNQWLLQQANYGFALSNAKFEYWLLLHFEDGSGITSTRNCTDRLKLAGVGRAVKHAGQTTLYLTPMHAATGKLMTLITTIRAALSHVRAVAEQLPNTDRWRTFLDYVAAKVTRPLPPWLPSKQLEAKV